MSHWNTGIGRGGNCSGHPDSYTNCNCNRDNHAGRKPKSNASQRFWKYLNAFASRNRR